MNQYNDRCRQWGEGGGWSRLKRLKIDLTSTDDDGEVRRVFEEKKKDLISKKRGGKKRCLFAGGVCQVIGSLHVTTSILSLPSPSRSSSLALYSCCKCIDYFKY